MVTEPVEKVLLETQKKVLVGRIAMVINDPSLLKEIQELTNTGNSFKSALRKILASSNPDPISTIEIRKKVSVAFPDATAPYDELIKVCQRLARIDNPMVVY